MKERGCTGWRRGKRVGPPDATQKTDGPVPQSFEILAGKGGFAGQRDATQARLAMRLKAENGNAVLT
jgi:hypothetical protein